MEAFGRVLRAPHVLWLFASSTVARMPYGIEGLATVLYVQAEKDSFAAAGAVSAAGLIASGAGLPVLGRLIDLLGQTRVIVASIAFHAAGGLALIALVQSGAPTAVLCAVAAVAGFTTPPISPALRSLWNHVLGDDPVRLRAAMALDAIALELVFIGGPLLTALLVAVASPAAALVSGYALATVGGLAFVSAEPSRAWRGNGTGSLGLGPLSSPGLLTVLGVSVPLGISLGAIEVGLPAFGVAEGSGSAGAVAIAGIAMGSAAGGLLYGSRSSAAGLVHPFVLFTLVWPVGVALLATPSSLAAMLVLAPVAGLVLAPLSAAANELAGRVAPAGTVTEAYAWVVTATLVGLAGGTALAGAIIEAAGWREALLAGAAGAVLGSLVALARRATLHA